MPLLACQKRLTTQGLSHDTLAQCAPLIDTIPSRAVRREFAGYLQYQLETAKTLGLDQVGLPISSDAIESLFGVAKQHGMGEIKDVGRMALRLPALCGTPTREEAQQVLEISVAEQQELGCVPPFTHGVFHWAVRLMMPTMMRALQAVTLTPAC